MTKDQITIGAIVAVVTLIGSLAGVFWSFSDRISEASEESSRLNTTFEIRINNLLDFRDSTLKTEEDLLQRLREAEEEISEIKVEIGIIKTQLNHVR